jgi:hypothetical protein
MMTRLPKSNNLPTKKHMKLLLSALCASFMVAPLAIAADCEKGKCDKSKQEEGTLAGKCKDKDGEEAKEEGTLAGKCKDKDGDCDKEEEGTLAGKCKDKDGDCDKEEGTLA